MRTGTRDGITFDQNANAVRGRSSRREDPIGTLAPTGLPPQNSGLALHFLTPERCNCALFGAPAAAFDTSGQHPIEGRAICAGLPAGYYLWNVLFQE
jgi:hypothetical protein